MTSKKVNKATDSSERVDSDSYDRGIIPAETAARKQREGDNYKTLPTEETQEDASTNDQSNTESINTTDGYTIDQEGLVNNYAVEPEMYYETPGDARKNAIQDSADRVEELREVNEDQEGKLTEKGDTRGKGPGRI
ncbi:MULTISPECIES: hypothetical protein [unclassified Nodularia (in: cyanobacteria)]|uniref:hypothetical protein n=1 Tax=unclassified Nodularia (in: cyanobacteria) TaxID=2656917 RepID=UPI00187ECDB0|nr:MULTISPECIES: hypothetical protein [unclassified Nodularia (in: cyanobacteria)]MBE9199193.1 hypothetical protein [Nodularia sp. LEGE 06071]MCC2695661.1 hypothetical protein [Nodularia sp. LEGE 04288]